MSYLNFLPQHIVTWNDVTVGNTKSFTFPSDGDYQLLWGEIIFTTTATVGSRRPKIQVFDTDGTTLRFESQQGGTAQAASLTYTYGIYTGTVKDTNIANGTSIPVPRDFVLPASFVVKVLDNLNVDAADTLKIYARFVRILTY